MLQLVEQRRVYTALAAGVAVMGVGDFRLGPADRRGHLAKAGSQALQRLAPLPIGGMHARDRGEHEGCVRADIGRRRHIGRSRLACHALLAMGLAGHRLA